MDPTTDTEPSSTAPQGPRVQTTTIEFRRPWLYEKQQAAIYDPARFSFIEASTKAGKAQPLDALIYTPKGPVRMGDIAVGDEVLTPDGGRANVRAIYPQGIREIMRVTFSDGSSTEVDRDHLWELHQFHTRPRVVTTKAIAGMKPKHLHRSWVPAILPVDFDPAPVPFDAYALGLLLGDGGMTTEVITFSSADPDLSRALEAALPAGHFLRKEPGDNADWRITAGSGAAALRQAGMHLRGILKKIGVIGPGSHAKSVPPIYKYNSIAVRRAMLQGLLDTDGFVDKHGQPGIEQTSPQLAKDIEEIVQSLGGTVLSRYRAVNGYRKPDGEFVQCRPVYRQVIRFPDATWCFRLERKRALVRCKRKTGHRMFRSIEHSRFAEAQCIEIDHPRQLYLTDGFIPTHNTVGCIIWITELALAGPGQGRNYWWVAPVSTQAEIAFTRMTRYLPQGTFGQNRTLKTIVLMNGAVIWFKGGDRPDTLYGEDVFGAVVDEASRLKEPAWIAVRSTLVATNGPARIIGNVKGKRNWFYKLARRAEIAPTATRAYHRITASDAVASGVLVKEEIEDARGDMTEQAFQELFYAIPSDDEGNPFGAQHIRACTAPLTSLPPVVWGWDLGRRRDYAAGIALDMHGHACRFERFTGMPWPDIITRIKTLTGRTPALVDSTGLGDVVVEMMQKDVPGVYEGYTFTQRSKQQLMEGLAVAIQAHELSFPEGPVTLELEAFEYEYTRTSVKYSAPDGYHDDCVCALALANQHRTHAKMPLIVSPGALARAAQRSLPRH